jgi:hypothetical protein
LLTADQPEEFLCTAPAVAADCRPAAPDTNHAIVRRLTAKTAA